MISYDRPYIQQHYLSDCSSCSVTTTSTAYSPTTGWTTHSRTVKALPKRAYRIGPVEIHQVEHVRLEYKESMEPAALTKREKEKVDRERGYGSADEAGAREREEEKDGRHSPTRRKLDKTSVISRMLSRTRLRPSVQPPPLLHPTGGASPTGNSNSHSLDIGREPRHIHHLQNGKLPSFDESFDVSAYYTGDGPPGSGVTGERMVPEFDSPKRSRRSEDAPSFYTTINSTYHPPTSYPSHAHANSAGPSATGSPDRNRGRISPSRAHFSTNPKLFPTSSPRAYQYEPLPSVSATDGGGEKEYKWYSDSRHPLRAMGGSISSTAGIKEPPLEPYPSMFSSGKGNGNANGKTKEGRPAVPPKSSPTRAVKQEASEEDDDGEDDGDRTLNADTGANASTAATAGNTPYTKSHRKRPASISASTIPLPPSPPHTAIMPSSFVLPLELRRAPRSPGKDGASENETEGGGPGMGNVKRERVPTPIPGDMGVKSMRLSPFKTKSGDEEGVVEHGTKRSSSDTQAQGQDQNVKAEGGTRTVGDVLGLPSNLGQSDTETPGEQKEDVFADFDRYFTDFPSARRVDPAFGAAHGCRKAEPTPSSSTVPHSSSRSHAPLYRSAEYPISAALTRERSLPTPPLTNGSSSGSSNANTNSTHSGTQFPSNAKLESAVASLQAVIQTLQATGADQAAAVLRQAELEMRLQSMDEEMGAVREVNVRLEVQCRREREERRRERVEWEKREGGWREKVRVAEEATSTAQTSLHHLHLSQSASTTRIHTLESDLRASSSRNTALQGHINELESEIVRLGGAFDLVKADYARREEQLKKKLAEAEFMHHALKESGARIGRELEGCKKRAEEAEKRSRGYI